MVSRTRVGVVDRVWPVGMGRGRTMVVMLNGGRPGLVGVEQSLSPRRVLYHPARHVRNSRQPVCSGAVGSRSR